MLAGIDKRRGVNRRPWAGDLTVHEGASHVIGVRRWFGRLWRFPRFWRLGGIEWIEWIEWQWQHDALPIRLFKREFIRIVAKQLLVEFEQFVLLRADGVQERAAAQAAVLRLCMQLRLRGEHGDLLGHRSLKKLLRRD